MDPVSLLVMLHYEISSHSIDQLWIANSQLQYALIDL